MSEARLERGGIWVLSGWLAAVTVWYVWTAVQAVRHPLNSGADRKWVVCWLAYALIALLWHVLLSRPLAAALWSAGRRLTNAVTATMWSISSACTNPSTSAVPRASRADTLHSEAI